MKFGSIIILIGLIFGICETIYFGSHWLPESKVEFVCDMLSVAISFLGLGFFLADLFNRIDKSITTRKG